MAALLLTITLFLSIGVLFYWETNRLMREARQAVLLKFRHQMIQEAITLYMHRPRMYHKQWHKLLEEAGDTDELNLSGSEKILLRDMRLQERIWSAKRKP